MSEISPKIASPRSERQLWIVFDGGMINAADALYSEIRAAERGTVLIGDSRVHPISAQELRQNIRDGKLDPRDLRGFGGTFLPSPDAKTGENCDNMPALLFLLRDCKGNIKLCNSDGMVASVLGDDFVDSGIYPWVNDAAARARYILLSIGYPVEYSGKDS